MITFSMIEASVATFFLSTLCLSAIIGFQTWRLKRLKTSILNLQQQLDLFVDASINVARVVDKAIHRPPSTLLSPLSRQSSRRWILKEAR